ncbi:hypothetical protein WJX81_007951 [Elliptochloris bilobata]|uniref:Peptidase C14 caspase domain-containing protein n=1 Tax=Elliptochloris bilobata TaxID=381761 RepID=A0AAW1SL61_9CHLO
MPGYAPGFPAGGPPPQGQQGWSQGSQGPYPPMQPALGAPCAPPLVLDPGHAPPPFPTPGQDPTPGAAAQQPVAVPPPDAYHAQPNIPQTFQPTGRKKALICACNYAGSHCALGGCINDAHCMAYMLKSRFGFQDADITMLTDDQGDPNRWPTRGNMLYQMQMLTWNTQPGDSLFFHFSGHGSQAPDYTGDESDGLNETICPCDFQTAGMIIDDEINRLLVNPVPPNVRLHAVIDACHSGTAMDLEYRCKAKHGEINWKMEYDHQPSVYKGTAGGEVIQFGAARDRQTAADTAALSGNVSTGAATFAFIQAVERIGTQITYGQLLMSMAQTLEQVAPAAGDELLSGAGMQMSKLGGIGKMLNKLIDGARDAVGMSGQQPTMCCNYAFDLNRPLAI